MKPVESLLLPRESGDYKVVWVIASFVALLFTPFVVIFRDTAPWFIAVPLALGGLLIVLYEAHNAGLLSRRQPSDVLVCLPEEYRGLIAYEKLMALEIKPRKKISKDQLLLFPGFPEPTPTNSIRMVQDEAGNKLPIINCDRYSALLIEYLMANLDKATEHALLAGLERFGQMGGRANAIHIFITDKAIRETVKSDFRGNLLTLVAKGGEKVVKDLVKAAETRAKAVETTNEVADTSAVTAK